ncbi:MAG TPA: penicillin-binding transpeptidase domain-containing protein [Patescibacteria group bacterium]|nr:penicillin-binding transpeptidase domain-containing protein [Patescibacteria group bacterium]
MKVGPVFFDHLYSEKIPKRHFGARPENGVRYWLLPLLLLLLFGFLFLRLVFLQIIQGAYYHKLSDSNRIKSIPIHAPRGVIFDRNGKPLVINAPGYRQVMNGTTKFISSSDAVSLLTKNDPSLEIDSLRMYPCGLSCAHVVGYVGQISPNNLKNPLFEGYRPTDVIGKMGAEQYYEPILKGIDGAKLIEVDATGKQLRILGQTDPTPGQNITLTIDEDMQKTVALAMKDVKKGAAIVSKPDGEILALYSSPSFDPNLFTMGKNYATTPDSVYQTVEQILLDGSYQPLLDRAISGTYPPGSTFKLVVAAAALQNNIIDQNFSVEDNGILKVGNFSFANWYFTDYGKTEGEVNVVKAIQRSNDIFFYKVGQMVGVDKLSGFAKEFGLGTPLGIDLVGEAGGLLPTKEWKQKVIGDQWYLGDDYHYGIGQGYLLTTPLQVNMWTQVIANGGSLYLPHILSSLPTTVKQEHLLTTENTNLIRQGMIEACDTGGVAWPLFNFQVQNPKSQLTIDGKDFYQPENASSSAAVGVRVACKTGTAQHGSDTTLPDAWITAYAPAYHPQVVVTVLAEDSGEGSNVAGPVLKQILEKYFGK